MKCPYCNNEMISGFFFGARPLFFSERKGFFKFPRKGDIFIKDNEVCAKIYNCVDCNKIIVDYSKMQEYNWLLQ